MKIGIRTIIDPQIKSAMLFILSIITALWAIQRNNAGADCDIS
jgi:hypothetical protein